MKIINLIEDTRGENGCLYEHGLSFYIETEHHKVLLDTGASDAFIKNAEALGIKLANVDTVIISHGHYDHSGGLISFAKLNPHAVIYIHKNAVGDFYSTKNGTPKYIGMDKDIQDLENVVFIDGNIKFDAELSLFSGVKGKRLLPRGNRVLKSKVSGELLQDSFDHEQYLAVSENGVSVLLSGCAHNGILNILDEYKNIYGGEPTYAISGFHTTKGEYTNDDDDLIEQTAKCLMGMNTVFYTGHCTGEYPMHIFKKIMGEKLQEIHSGSRIL